jgi:hypothetical protein
MSYIGAQPTTAAFVTDTFSANGSGTVFTLSVAPANTNSILVAVSGVLQDPSTYSVSGTTLTFSAAPPAGTGNISVRFLGIPASGVVNTAYRTQTEFTATAGQTTFSVPSYTVGFIDVYRNGALLGSADFTATNGTTVVLANPASSGDLVETISFFVSSVVNAIPAQNNAVIDSYINSGAVTTAKIADANVTQAKLAAGVAGNGPAFSASRSGSDQSISSATWTKAQWNNELFDTANCYDPTTNYRFTPNVAGYYLFTMTPLLSVASSFSDVYIQFYINGAGNNQYAFFFPNGNTISPSLQIIVYMNGTTDYIESYIRITGTSPIINAGGGVFNGVLVRSA